MSFLSPNFFIHSINIGSVEGASCVNIGNNLASGFTSHKKHNQGFGTIQGDHNDISRILTKLDDADQIDMPDFTNDNEQIPEWFKQFLDQHSDKDKNEEI